MLRRVSVHWELEEPLPWPELARRMVAAGQALAIVNLRNHAGALFRALKAAVPEHDGLFHLSTRMCAAHRLSKIAQIRARLLANEPCLVSSTQLVEAGVDLDFPAVFRALAPLDSIVQAAGRCDREGLLTVKAGTAAGKMTVFRSEDGKTPPHEYKEATEITAAMCNAATLSIDAPDTMTRYFHRYYGEASAKSLGATLEDLRDKANFQNVADEFRMISDYKQDVFVAWDNRSRELIGQLDAIGTMTAELRRKLQRYIVSLSPGEFLEARRGAVRRVRDTDFWVCVDGLYDDDLGILAECDANSMII